MYIDIENRFVKICQKFPIFLMCKFDKIKPDVTYYRLLTNLQSSGLREKGQPLRTVNEDDVRRAHALLPLGEFEGAAVADLNEAMDDEDEEEDDELGAFLREQGLLPQDGDAADEQNGMALDSDEDDEEDEEDEDEDDEEGEEPSEESE